MTGQQLISVLGVSFLTYKTFDTVRESTAAASTALSAPRGSDVRVELEDASKSLERSAFLYGVMAAGLLGLTIYEWRRMGR